ncbi:MAG: hypothetical protein M3N51_05260 [Actinomycetota bacterium]|nr:hypothetical protein [Actinomycetota bacterium]
MFIRLFLSSVAPGDLAQVERLFREDVIPAFQAHPDCLGIQLIMAAQADVAGLVEGGAISRWKTLEGMNEALLSPKVRESQNRIRELLRREPVQKVYEVRA